MRFRTANIRSHMIGVVAGISLLLVNNAAFAQRGRAIRNPINENDVVRRHADVHRLARPEFDQGLADTNVRMDKMVLALGLSPDAGKEVEALIEQQHDPSSPSFHQWLSPDEFETRFGMSDDDLNTITGWLKSHGFTVDEVGKERRWINFSGNVGQVERAFHTEMRKYLVNGEAHYANATAPAIPRALDGAVTGVVSLHDFPTKSGASLAGSPSGHALAPADFARIYNAQPLYDAGINGTGMSIAIVGRAKINTPDVVSFRQTFNLPCAAINASPNAVAPKGLPSVQPSAGGIVQNPCLRPGGTGGALDTIATPGMPDNQFTFNTNTSEALLDVEWSGAIAPYATIKYVYGPHPAGGSNANVPLNDTGSPVSTTGGEMFAAQYIVQKRLAPIVSMSFYACEQKLKNAGSIPNSSIARQFLTVNGVVPSTFAQFYNALWQQAVAQGMSVFVISGDSGSAGCDDDTGTLALKEPGVNVMCSTPYSVCVGGTQFADGANPTAYWNADGSAKSYIPEQAWNEHGPAIPGKPAGLWATGGAGISILYAQPAWQTGTWRLFNGLNWMYMPTPGVPADGIRRVPDIALASAFHTPYLVTQDGQLGGMAGTSAACPSFAGLMALVEQSNGQWLGNANVNLYALANRQFWGGSPVLIFHDVTVGNNVVPYSLYSGKSGDAAGGGYDQVTGLGSVDAAMMAYAWGMSYSPVW